MRRCASAAARPGLAVLAALLIGGCGTAASTRTASTSTSSQARGAAAALTITPSQGSPSTVFRAQLTGAAPRPAGKGEKVGFELGFRGPSGAHCVGAGSLSLPQTPGASLAAALDPSHLGGHWCPGTFVVRVQEIASPKCATGTMCPQFVRVVGTVAQARFRVSG